MTAAAHNLTCTQRSERKKKVKAQERFLNGFFVLESNTLFTAKLHVTRHKSTVPLYENVFFLMMELPCGCF